MRGAHSLHPLRSNEGAGWAAASSAHCSVHPAPWRVNGQAAGGPGASRAETPAGLVVPVPQPALERELLGERFWLLALRFLLGTCGEGIKGSRELRGPGPGTPLPGSQLLGPWDQFSPLGKPLAPVASRPHAGHSGSWRVSSCRREHEVNTQSCCMQVSHPQCHGSCPGAGQHSARARAFAVGHGINTWQQGASKTAEQAAGK